MWGVNPARFQGRPALARDVHYATCMSYSTRHREEERRQWPRVSFDKRVIAYTDDQQRLRCQVLNLSAGGLALDASAVQLEASWLRLNLPLSDGHTVAVDGLVIEDRQTRTGRTWHLCFENVPTPIRARLASFVDERRPRLRP